MGISRKGRKRMYKGNASKLVPESQVQYFLDNGWQFGMPAGVGTTGRKNMHNPETGKQLQVPADKVAEYQAKGWVLGLPKGRTQNAIWIKKGSIEKKIAPASLDFYVKDGWTKGRVKTTAGRVWMHKGDEYKMVLHDDVDKYQDAGFVIGGQSPTLNKRWINKDGELKLVDMTDLSAYLAEGWKVGFGLRWVHNDTECKRVPASQLPDYISQGWETGLPVGHVSIMKEDEEKHIPVTSWPYWEAQGWKRASTTGVQDPTRGTFTVYKLTSPDNKVYVGMTKNLSRRMAEHRNLAESTDASRTAIVKALRTFGFDAFTQDILATDLSFDEACEQETSWIAYYDSTNPEKGYNDSFGGMGRGVRYNDICRFNNSQAQRSRPKPQPSPNHRTRKIKIG